MSTINKIPDNCVTLDTIPITDDSVEHRLVVWSGGTIDRVVWNASYPLAWLDGHLYAKRHNLEFIVLSD